MEAITDIGGEGMKKIIKGAVGMLLMCNLAFAESPVQLSVPGKNFPGGDVKGGRLSLLYGKSSDATGLNVSVLGLSQVDDFKGLQLGLFLGATRVDGDFTGVSASLFNWQKGVSKGVNFGLVNYTRDMRGVNLGLVNYSEERGVVDLGLLNVHREDAMVNLGLVNYSGGETTVDIGLVNYAESTTFQLGLINATKNLDGVQVGLINYAANGVVPVLPIINFRKSI